MTFAQLKAALIEWAHRSNIPATTVDLFVALAEAEFNSRLRCGEQETVADLQCTARYTPLPADLLEIRGVEHKAAPLTPLRYGAPEYLAILRSAQIGGHPRAYSIIGTDIELMPAPDDTTVTLTYWARIPALSSANPTNWLLEKHPNMYLMECLRQLALYTKDDAAVNRYAAQMQGYYSAMRSADRDRRHPGPMVVRAA